jgi:peroxidase
LQDPNDLEVVFGTSAVFRCSAEGDPTPEIKWMRDSNEIDSSDSRFRVSSDGTLQIERIDARDQGRFVKENFNVKSISHITN